jgi:hypothetical protein
MRVEVALVRCWLCEMPFSTEREGKEVKTTRATTLWMKMGQAVATQHHDECPFRGREVSDWEGTVDQRDIKEEWNKRHGSSSRG